MSKREQLLISIADTIQDYRAGEISKPTPEHVDRWIEQFDKKVQLDMLHEIDHILKQTYYSRERVSNFLTEVFDLPKMNHCRYWRKANFLRDQQKGNSQNDMLKLFDEILEAKCGLKTTDCGEMGGDYLYVDEAMFSGNHTLTDLKRWITKDAPTEGLVYVIMAVIYGSAKKYVKKELEKTIYWSGKKIDVRYWAIHEMDKFNWVLWPTRFPSNKQWQKFQNLRQKHELQLRPVSMGLNSPMFSSEVGRRLLERELTVAGARIWGFSKTPGKNLRPLGFQNYGFGFGSMVVTFRNCPNNVPLALWWGDPNAPDSHPLSRWYPLLSRY